MFFRIEISMRDECIIYLFIIIYNKIVLKCYFLDFYERFFGCEFLEEGEFIFRFVVIILVVYREGLFKWIFLYF